jgi:dynein heavy chain
MSSFFFPQGFLTGVLQEYARHPDRQIAIDELVFSFKFTEMTKERCSIKAVEGVYIHGLYLEGACWDNSKKILTEPIKVILLSKLRTNFIT